MAKSNDGTRDLELLTTRVNCNGYIRRYMSLSEAARILKVSSSHISAYCKGKRNSAGGYKWVYEK